MGDFQYDRRSKGYAHVYYDEDSSEHMGYAIDTLKKEGGSDRINQAMEEAEANSPDYRAYFEKAGYRFRLRRKSDGSWELKFREKGEK